jgi:hypothetical protein
MQANCTEAMFVEMLVNFETKGVTVEPCPQGATQGRQHIAVDHYHRAMNL